MLIEGPFETDYSLAIVNRRLALALLRQGHLVSLHQRDNTTDYPPSASFFAAWPELAPCFVSSVEDSREEIHSRYIYPPFTDRMTGTVRAVHCYGWEESAFPREYVEAFNRDLDVITVMSRYVRDVLVRNGVTVPVKVAGLGADHILESAAEPVGCFERDAFHFLHISSCFPRKGADVLVEGFCRAFERNEDVRLLIKTFINPHNEIENIVANAFSRYPNHPPIQVMYEPFSPGQMRSLMEQANCLVAPSRGEGFGLPVAEAMLLGTPVVATIHGGHADICSPDWCWPVDFQLSQARTHLTQGDSFWAEPDVHALASILREIYRSDRRTIREKTERAKKHVAENFTWAETARRHEQACARVLDTKRAKYANPEWRDPSHIAFITTWNVRCGIAEYTRYLSSSLGNGCTYSVFANRIAESVRPDESNVFRCWNTGAVDMDEHEIDEFVRGICGAGCDAVSIQYNFSFLSPRTMAGLIRRLKARRIPVAVTLHATRNKDSGRLFSILTDAQAVIVHRAEERDMLRKFGLTNVHVQRQGIYVKKDLQRSEPAGTGESAFTVACFGFFLPPKGIYELLQAFSAAAFVNSALRLKLINSLYDIPESHAYAAECIRFIEAAGLSERTLVCTDFLDQDTILRELAESDLVVLPYTHSTESSSAAIRLPLASLTPVLCSDIQLFREFEGIVHLFPAGDTMALANRLLELSADPALLQKFDVPQRRYVQQLAWENVARDFQHVIASSIAPLTRTV